MFTRIFEVIRRWLTKQFALKKFRLVSKRNGIILAIVVIMYLFYGGGKTSDRSLRDEELSKMDVPETQIAGEEIVVSLCLCIGNRKQPIDAQLKQTRLNIKSIAALSTQPVTFYIYTDTDLKNDQLVDSSDGWTDDIKRRVKVNIEQIQYPPGTDYLLNYFKPCATHRMYLPGILTNVEKLIYLDTDTLLHTAIEELWNFFHDPELDFMMAMAPRLNPNILTDPNADKQPPFVGIVGLNSGVLLFNMTKNREVFPGQAWIDKINEIYNKYVEHLTYGDQGILNVILDEMPELVHELGCKWNYHRGICITGKNFCLEARSHGANVVHCSGKAGVKTSSFGAIVDAWLNHKLSDPIENLVGMMDKGLEKYEVINPCDETVGIKTILTRSIRRYAKRIAN